MLGLDTLDRRILWELSRDGRKPVAQLSRNLKQSRERIDYRLNRLRDSQIIQGYVATINPQYLGYGIYKTYLRLENDRPMVEKLCQHIRAHKRLAWFGVCDGSWDIAFCLYAINSKEFHDLHVKILSEFNSVVLNFASYTLTDIRMYDRNYLWKGAKTFTRLGGDVKPVELDEMDKALVRELHKDGRATISELSERLNTTHVTIQNRMDRLEKMQIITGYRAMLNLNQLDMQCVKTMFFLRSYDVELRREFLKFCDSHPNVTCYTEQVGDCNLEVEVEVPALESYSALIDEIRGRYAKLIKNFYTMMLRETAHHWLPRDWN